LLTTAGSGLWQYARSPIELEPARVSPRKQIQDFSGIKLYQTAAWSGDFFRLSIISWRAFLRSAQTLMPIAHMANDVSAHDIDQTLGSRKRSEECRPKTRFIPEQVAVPLRQYSMDAIWETNQLACQGDGAWRLPIAQ
jgi:hypothetical protein